MSDQKIFYSSLVIALVFHLVIAVLLVAHFDRTKRHVGESQFVQVKSYLVKQSSQTKNTVATSLQKSIEKPRVSKVAAQSSSRRYQQKKQEGDGVNDLLLKLLHEKIQQQQQYPLQAQLRHQQGHVLVSFNLLSQGEIAQIQVVKSSGYHLLDQAAIDAVAGISPVQDAQNINHQRRELVIDVGFELG